MYNLFLGNRLSLLRLAFLLTTNAVMCFAFLPLARAVTPAPDGGYAGENTAEGTNALLSRTTGIWNTANGFEALKKDTTGGGNTAIGFHTLFNNTVGKNNTAVGPQALLNNVGGDNNIAVGALTGINVRGSNNIDIGNPGTSADTNTMRIGSQGVHMETFLAGIHGTILPNNGTLQPVFVNDMGKLGTVLSPPPSSARFKDEIKPMGNASESILAFKPVTFRYKKNIDPLGVPQFGLVAEEVAKVNPDLVTRDEKGQLYTVRYDAVNAMVLNEFLKEHRKVEQLEKQIKSLTAGLQKVSAQLEASKPASRVVNNP
jgi:hypothetical protein